MKTWNDYKEYVRTVDPETAKDIKETEEVAAIVTAMIEQRNALGLSQRELAAMCGLPQSSVARIESCKTTPNLGTLLNIFQHLGLTLPSVLSPLKNFIRIVIMVWKLLRIFRKTVLSARCQVLDNKFHKFLFKNSSPILQQTIDFP